LYLHAAKQIDIAAELCVAIEDSAHGIRAAKGAGMFCIGINTSKNLDNLKEADFIIDTYHDIDLPRLLKK
jgi:beta-phosphoglucomutase-like phosphatase (HAD superfamily)